jgi:hypothetical protein
VLILVRALSSEHTRAGGRTANGIEGIPSVRIVISLVLLLVCELCCR